MNEDIVRYRISRAKDCYTSAKCLYLDGLLEDSADRSYFAMYHAIRAVLALGQAEFKEHRDVIVKFIESYIDTGIFNKETAKTIQKAYAVWHDCNYLDGYSADREKVKELYQDALELISLVENYIDGWKK